MEKCNLIQSQQTRTRCMFKKNQKPKQKTIKPENSLPVALNNTKVVN